MKRVPESDLDALRKGHRFVRDDDKLRDDDDHAVRLAKKYERNLYREYALADLSHYRSKKIGLRWRTKRECETGKGETTCGNLSCDATGFLSSYELPFSYREGTEKKKVTTLVKLRVCPECADKVAHVPNKTTQKKTKTADGQL